MRNMDPNPINFSDARKSDKMNVPRNFKKIANKFIFLIYRRRVFGTSHQMIFNQYLLNVERIPAQSKTMYEKVFPTCN